MSGRENKTSLSPVTLCAPPGGFGGNPRPEGIYKSSSVFRVCPGSPSSWKAMLAMEELYSLLPPDDQAPQYIFKA